MKILKLLNKVNLLIIIFFFFILIHKANTNEPVDIWNVDSKKNTEESIINDDVSGNDLEEGIYEKQIKNQNQNILAIEQDETLISKNIKIAGLYDPSENDLNINMWSNSDGNKILDIYKRIEKIKLSTDAKEILNTLFLTNSYFPQKNITEEKFIKLKVDLLIRNNETKLIEDYVVKNKGFEENIKLIQFVVNEHLSNANLEKSCDILSKVEKNIDDNYLTKFNIYCLINQNKKEEAQLLFDIKKELGFKDKFFENIFNYLMGYSDKIENKVSEKSILNFHLSHRVNSNFIFEPNESTSKIIWRYLSSSNLLDDLTNVDLEDKNKIILIEKATHEGNFSEKDLYDLYRRFQFNINQLLSVKQSYKLLSSTEARALVYQGILITNEIDLKLELTRLLKNLFLKDEITNAFKTELVRILSELNKDNIPSNHLSFYNNFLIDNVSNQKKVRVNNKILHKSKLLNHFRTDVPAKNTQKDLNDLLRKIKKNKNYFFSTKDVIVVESLKSDGIKVLKKYDNLYEKDNSNMPKDIQKLINNNDTGMVLLRIAEIIGQDELKDIGSETLYFIVSALNQLNIDKLRNKILLKVLPLKV
tara:strand:+ start:161 stop:1927 length:1767 start_codon:yes stop_codon:yes gene_type:complete